MMSRAPSLLTRSLAVFALLALGCSASRAQAPSALEAAVADDEDLGNPRSEPEELDAEAQAALLNDPSATQLDFDGAEENDAPTDVIMVPGDREPMPSMMKDIVLAPSG